MGTLRRIGPDLLWILAAAVSGGLYGGLVSSRAWWHGALIGLAWGLVLTVGWAIRRRRKDTLLHR